MVTQTARKLGWGLVGCGWVAADYVAPAIDGSSNGHVVAVHDRDPSAMNRLARSITSAPHSYNRLEDLLADDRV